MLRYVSLVAYVALALVTINQWRRQRDHAAAWAALGFGTLGVVVVLGQIVPKRPQGFFENFLQRLDIAFLLLFPYLLHRFTTVFRTATSGLERGLGLMTVAMIVWTFALPHIPESGQARWGWFIAYLAGFLIHWTVLSSVAATRLWRAGRGQPSVARRRMRLLAFAAALLTIALFAAAATSQSYSASALASSVFSIASAAAFLVALAPPAVLRMIWRRPAQERVQDAIRDLITLSRSQAEVASRVLAPMADIVGARALCIRNEERELIGSYGLPEGELDGVERPVGPLPVLSRLDADAISITPERINLRHRIEEIVASVAAERSDDVRISVDPELEAPADPGALDRIVGNLVANALRYGSPPISVRAVHHDRHLRLFVEDRGEGVPPKFVPELFERFTRGGRERVGGTGLGLAIARSYARAPVGDLVYEDAEPHGARFQLVLPVKNGNGEADEVDLETPPEVETHGWRLLARRR